jgi:hypothetical protein
VYRELAESTTPAVGTVEPLLQQAAERPLTALPGLQHQGRLADALVAFERATGLDPLQSRPVRARARLHARAARHYTKRAAELNPLDDRPQGPEGADRP